MMIGEEPLNTTHLDQLPKRFAGGDRAQLESPSVSACIVKKGLGRVVGQFEFDPFVSRFKKFKLT